MDRLRSGRWRKFNLGIPPAGLATGLCRDASITAQQLAKNRFLSAEKSLVRKLSEFFPALGLEHEITQQRILHLVGNVIEFGPGIFGVEAAVRQY